MKKHISILSAFLILGIVGHSQKLPSFGADMGKKSIGPKEVRIPYTDMISYYGFISPGVEPDEVKDGKNFFFVYMWVPAAAPELGVRMVSPVPSGMVAGEGDFASEEYTKNASDTKSYFDTFLCKSYV